MPLDPATLGFVAKLLASGVAGWKAYAEKGFNDKELDTIRALIESGAAAPRKTEVLSPEGQFLLMIFAVFGESLRRYWKSFKGSTFASQTDDFKIRLREAEGQFESLARLATVDDRQREIEKTDALLHSPFQTPYYKTLWEIFSTQTQEGQTTNLWINPKNPTERRNFEACFLLEYLDALQKPGGQGIQAALKNFKEYRKKMIHELFIEDIAGWGDRHVFGNLPRNSEDLLPGFPFLPLGETYVQPDAFFHGGNRKLPVLTHLKKLLEDPKQRGPFIVRADFGNGKSLSARMFASQLAQGYLDRGGPASSLPFPVFIRCSQDFPDDRFDLLGAVKLAWKRHADEIGLNLTTEDEAFQLPDSQTPVVFFLDGLDEVMLAARGFDTLIEDLWRKSNKIQHFILFSRPGAFPEHGEALQRRKPPVLDLRPLTEQQIEEWITKWNKLAPPNAQLNSSSLAERGLEELAKTPILLFMLASTWDKFQHTEAGPPTKAEIFEEFFWHIARGKHEQETRDTNKTVSQAARHICEVLTNPKRGELPVGTETPAAMLWLMSRVAWEAHRLGQRTPPETLARLSLDNILKDELAIEPGKDNFAAAKVGLLLALQADLQAENHQILFGHKSFREFLVGRYWAHQLRRILSTRLKDRKEEEKKLLDADILPSSEDQSFDFLMECLNSTRPPIRKGSPVGWTDHERKQLFDWAQDCFEDEAQLFKRPDAFILREDRRLLLRKAALAIGSELHGSPGIEIKAEDSIVLRIFMGALWAIERDFPLRASRSRFARVNLCGADLGSVDLRRADLSHADLSRASLVGTNLYGADLSGANLANAIMFGANIDRANLGGADLSGVDLSRVNLKQVNLVGAFYDAFTQWPANFDPEDEKLMLEYVPPGKLEWEDEDLEEIEPEEVPEE